MIIGVPKEIKNNEFRVSTTPSGVHAFVTAGHEVLVETNAGLGSAITDQDYIAAGAPLMTLHTDEPARFERALEILQGAVTIVEGGTVNRLPLVLERIQG